MADRPEHSWAATTCCARSRRCPGRRVFLQTNSSTRFFNSDSANIFFSSLFSRSSSLSRRASLISIRPNCRFHRWKRTSERLCSRQTSKIAWPLSTARKIRILSSVVYRLPFILSPFSPPQTNTTGGSKKRGHVSLVNTQFAVRQFEASPIFPWKSGDTISHLVKKASVEGGFPNLHLHHLRHSFGLSYIETGGDIRTLMELLEHSNISTEMIYTTLSPEYLAREINRVVVVSPQKEGKSA